MNCISWMVGHLANQENTYWVFVAQGKKIRPDLYPLVGYGKLATTPPLAEMWAAWHTITQASDEYLDTLTSDQLQQHFSYDRDQQGETVGTVLRRVTYHYWYHLGEGLAVRQLLGHADLPQFVGDIGGQAPYRPE